MAETEEVGARRLTDGEIALARRAFGDEPPYDKVRLCRGAGMNPAAAIAFMRRNPAITLVRTIYFKKPWHEDFSSADADSKADLLHEMTHILQYHRLGVVGFGLRYAWELAANGLNPNKLYKYAEAGIKFPKATLEGQAEMVGDYARAILGAGPGAAAQAAKIAPWLEGSGLFDLR
jgi:hypothetical protein